MTSDDETELMGELLARGATMLGEHCNECGNPLFRLRGQKLCAVCDQGEAVEKKQRVEMEAGLDEGEGPDEGVDTSGSLNVESDLRALAARLARRAREEEDLGRLRETLDALETTLDLLERV